MNKKGFTLMELIAVIVIIGLIAAIAIPAVAKYITDSQKKAYTNFEANMKGAAEQYFAVHTNLLVPGGDAYKVTGDELHDGGYLNNLNDPKDNAPCDYDNSYVKTSAVFATSDSYNLTYTYEVCLICSHYKSAACKDE